MIAKDPKRMLVLPTIIALFLLTLTTFSPAVAAQTSQDPLRPYASFPGVTASHFTQNTGQLVFQISKGTVTLSWNSNSPQQILAEITRPGSESQVLIIPLTLGTNRPAPNVTYHCAWWIFGCYWSFSKAEANWFLAQVNIQGTGIGVIAGILATIAGAAIIAVVLVLVAGVILYYAYNCANGFWIGNKNWPWGLGPAVGCN